MDALAAVHIANALVRETDSELVAVHEVSSRLDHDYLDGLDVTEKLSDWRDLVQISRIPATSESLGECAEVVCPEHGCSGSR